MTVSWLRRKTPDLTGLVEAADVCLRAIGDAVDGYGTEADRLAFIAATVTRWEMTRDGLIPAPPSTQDPHRKAA